MTLQNLMQQSPEARLTYSIAEIISNEQVWILVDDEGCVFLTSDDEDCVPVWPSEELARYWATGDWDACRPKAISLKDWFSKWTTGLSLDDVNVAVFPNPDEIGIVMYPDVFEQDLLQKQAKS